MSDHVKESDLYFSNIIKESYRVFSDLVNESVRVLSDHVKELYPFCLILSTNQSVCCLIMSIRIRRYDV